MGVSAINWVDYSFLAILVLSGLKGWATGILRSLVRIAGLIVSFWVAVTYHTKMAAWLSSQWGWADTLAQILKPLVKLPGPFNNAEILKLPVGLLQQISTSIPLPPPWPQIIGHLSKLGPHQNVGQAINLLLARGIIEIFSFVVILILVRGVINFLGSVILLPVRFTPLGLVDKMGGLVLGLITGCVIIAVIMTIMAPLQIPLALIGAQGILGVLARGLNDSYIMTNFGSLVYSTNIIPSLIPELGKDFLLKNLKHPVGTQI